MVTQTYNWWLMEAPEVQVYRGGICTVCVLLQLVLYFLGGWNAYLCDLTRTATIAFHGVCALEDNTLMLVLCGCVCVV